mgnify:FL=1
MLNGDLEACTYQDARVDTVQNDIAVIPDAPKSDMYIPVVVSHRNTNVCQESVFWDDRWIIYSSVAQNVKIRFYHLPAKW